MGIMRTFIYENENKDQIQFSSCSAYKLTSILGLSEQDIEIDETTSLSQIGSTLLSTHVASKSITMEGDFEFSRSKREELIRVISPSLKGKLRMIDGERDVYLEVVPTLTPLISMDTLYQKFQFVLRASYPYWRKSKKSSSSFTYYTSHFSFPRSFSNEEAWKISSRSLNIINNVVNDSDVDIGFSVIFKAITDVTAPELLNIITQERIKFKDDFILPAKDELIVYSYAHKKSVIWKKAGIEVNAFRYLDDVTTFFPLKPKDNIIRYGANQNYEGLEVLLTYETTLVGI